MSTDRSHVMSLHPLSPTNPASTPPPQGIRDASGMKFGLTQMKQPGAESDISLATDRAGQLVGDQVRVYI